MYHTSASATSICLNTAQILRVEVAIYTKKKFIATNLTRIIHQMFMVEFDADFQNVGKLYKTSGNSVEFDLMIKFACVHESITVNFNDSEVQRCWIKCLKSAETIIN